MEKRYRAKKIEPKIYKFWEKGNFFNPDKVKSSKKSTFTIVLPPPNITGSLHMGHALNGVVQDVLIRWRRMQGFKALWVPGTDHAGIATQNVVEKQLKKQGLTRFDLGREKFLKKVWEWKRKYGNIILDQYKKIGASCDWSRNVFTMDPQYVRAVYTAFEHYFQRGWIYRAERAVNWCPRCQTSLSDLELEYKEKKGYLWYIKYPLVKNGKPSKDYVVVATTRPETMLGDTAVAVNPKDRRYKNLVGKTALLPLVNREIPIIADSLVDPKFGTGALKITPAHSLVDYQIGLKHGLEMVQVIDEEAKITREAPRIYRGLNVEEARKRILKDLEKKGFLVKKEDYIHKIPRCYRCGTVVEVILSRQWFLKMNKLAKLAIDSLEKGKVRFHPPRWKKVYLDWLKNIRDWCISRQIWWGQRLPVWFCQQEKEKFFISFEKPKRCQICKKCKPRQSEDVFDTWFSSALWPFAVFGWPQKTRDLKRFYPTDVLSTAHDIINLWVARMIFSARELTKKNPFKDVVIHATVLTKEGKRMSKSLGTGIDPLDLIEKYGADATRFGLAWQITGLQDMRFDETHIVAGEKFCNKIWNASRFVLLQLGESKFNLKRKPQPLTQNDKRILKLLNQTIKGINKNLTTFRFGKAIQQIYHFFWHDFCDFYIEEAKKQIKEAKTQKEKETTQKVLLYVLVNSLKLLHPFMPFITEEIYQRLPLRSKKALIIEKWPLT